jgi:hypothetical protein
MVQDADIAADLKLGRSRESIALLQGFINFARDPALPQEGCQRRYDFLFVDQKRSKAAQLPHIRSFPMSSMSCTNMAKSSGETQRFSGC